MKSKLVIAVLLCGTLLFGAPDREFSFSWQHTGSTGVIGYVVYGGTHPTTMQKLAVLPYVNHADFTGLKRGTYYFAVTALYAENASPTFGRESNYLFGCLAVNVSSYPKKIKSYLVTDTFLICQVPTDVDWTPPEGVYLRKVPPVY